MKLGIMLPSCCMSGNFHTVLVKRGSILKINNPAA
jgi:hypothetical protein